MNKFRNFLMLPKVMLLEIVINFIENLANLAGLLFEISMLKNFIDLIVNSL